jgi:hypothetical protein
LAAGRELDVEVAPELTAVGALVAGSAFADLTSAMEGGLSRYTFLPGLVATAAMEASRAFGVLPTLRPVAWSVHCRTGLLCSFMHAVTLCWGWLTPTGSSRRRQTSRRGWR